MDEYSDNVRTSIRCISMYYQMMMSANMIQLASLCSMMSLKQLFNYLNQMHKYVLPLLTVLTTVPGKPAGLGGHPCLYLFIRSRSKPPVTTHTSTLSKGSRNARFCQNIPETEQNEARPVKVIFRQFWSIVHKN